jgi:hypothetical protein
MRNIAMVKCLLAATRSCSDFVSGVAGLNFSASSAFGQTGSGGARRTKMTINAAMPVGPQAETDDERRGRSAS